MNDALKKKIGQMLMISVPGESLSEHTRKLIDEYKIGNFCTSTENAVSVEGLCDLNSQIRSYTYDKCGVYPFISIDQEGGWVSRFYCGAAFIGGEMAYAASGADGDGMKMVGSRLGRILRAVGCNMNNAPVLDVNMDHENPIIGTRSYGDTPEKVAELGCGFAGGLMESGVLAVVKHFPGHGNVKGDTHLGATVNITDAEKFKSTELIPFKKAFESGVGALMTAHVTYTAFSNEPATVSREIMTDLLRGELNFDGVAISDSMNMNAMSQVYPNGEGAVRAIEAGCDILLFYPLNESIFLPAISAIYAAVESGRISEERINESYERIIRQKARFKVDESKSDTTLARSLVYNEKNINDVLCEKLSSVTCMKGREILSGLDKKKILCVSPICDAVRGVEESQRRILSFADDFANSFEDATACVSSLDGMTDKVRQAIDGEYDIAVVGVFDAISFPAQIEIINTLKKKGKSVVAVLLRSPYDYKFVKDCDAVITCYEYTTLAVSATVKAMKNNDYRGVLPIKIDI